MQAGWLSTKIIVFQIQLTHRAFSFIKAYDTTDAPAPGVSTLFSVSTSF